MKKTITVEFPDDFKFPKMSVSSAACWKCPLLREDSCILTHCSGSMLEKLKKPCPFYREENSVPVLRLRTPEEVMEELEKFEGMDL